MTAQTATPPTPIKTNGVDVVRKQPPGLVLVEIIERHTQHRLTSRQMLGEDTAVDIPHQQFHIELIIGHLAARPPHTPDGEALD